MISPGKMAIVSVEAQMKVQTKRHHKMKKESFPTMMCTIFHCHDSENFLQMGAMENHPFYLAFNKSVKFFLLSKTS